MKTKKVLAGVMTAAVMMCSVISTSAFAVGNTVQISASKETAVAGGEFTVEVSLADIPTTGVNGCEFAVNYDESLVKVDSVTAGPLTKTNAESNDSSSSGLPLFGYYNNTDKGVVNVAWSTAADSTYWMKGSGVLFTITGTVLSDAAANAVADFDIEPIARETYSGSGVMNSAIKIGYYDGTNKVQYDTAVSNGSVTVEGNESTSGTTGTTSGTVLYGDSNVDGKIDISDVVATRRYLTNSAKFPLSAQGLVNSDVQNVGGGLNAQDAVAIQQKVLGTVSSLPL